VPLLLLNAVGMKVQWCCLGFADAIPYPDGYAGIRYGLEQRLIKQARQARSGRGSGSVPSDHLELRRPGGGQALTYALDVRCRDVDAQQHGALRDLSLQGFGTFLW
jgi:hypothetical protein